jgi:hypothetical protein
MFQQETDIKLALALDMTSQVQSGMNSWTFAYNKLSVFLEQAINQCLAMHL